MAMGSASETEYHLLLARDLQYIDQESNKRIIQQVQETKRMLASLMKKLIADR